jgi:undecaprenyl diphosphate synthase
MATAAKSTSKKQVASVPDELDLKHLPRHLAIIMDGNGRWARKRGKFRIEGHRAGIRSVRDVVTACREIGIEYLTLHAFGVENWRRPTAEVSALMVLLPNFLRREKKTMLENGIRLNTIGRTDDLPDPAARTLRKVISDTAHCDRMTLTLALSYSGRSDLLDAVNTLISRARSGELPEGPVAESDVASSLSTNGLPDPDFVIRTSGEQRISNFMLWEISYAELWIPDILWPDFRREHLYQGLIEYQGRERRYGGLKK